MCDSSLRQIAADKKTYEMLPLYITYGSVLHWGVWFMKERLRVIKTRTKTAVDGLKFAYFLWKYELVFDN